MLHNIKLLYNNEKFVPPFLVRRYSHNSNVDLSTVYKSKSYTTNEYENELKFDEYAENYYKTHESNLSYSALSKYSGKPGSNLRLFRNKYHIDSTNNQTSSGEDLNHHSSTGWVNWDLI